MGVQPPIMIDEFTATGERIKDDPAFQAALARRGITDMSRVQVDRGRPATSASTWTRPGGGWPAASPTCSTGRAATRTRSRSRTWSPSGTGTRRRWSSCRTATSCRSLKRPAGTTRPASPRRARWRRCEILQPDGPGFTVDDGWLRVGPVAAADRPCTRSRAWCCTRSATSTGERGPADPVPGQHGRDGRAVRVDVAEPLVEERVRRRRRAASARWPTPSSSAATASARSSTWTRSPSTRTATPTPLKNAICLHEEDYGILWKHADLAQRRRRGAPVAADGRVVRSPPSATTSTASSGTSTWTARSRPR